MYILKNFFFFYVLFHILYTWIYCIYLCKLEIIF